MKRPQLHLTMDAAKLRELEEQAEHVGVPAPTLAAVILSAFADVMPVKLFPALGSIPESYRRPKSKGAKGS